jgi:hypothetical protein
MLIRPTFYFDKLRTQQIKAGGILFFRKIIYDNKQTVQFLMIKSRDIYEDFGGRTDINDIDYFDTVSREVEEESNKIFSRKDIYDRIKNIIPIYVIISKYVLYLLELTCDEQKLNCSDFGDKETHDNINRTVEYINIEKFKSLDFIKLSLHFRLRDKQIIEHIEKL